jgi:putative aminopeptidase FrvX
MKNEKFLKEYLNGFSPVGLESSGQNIWMKQIEELVDELHTDAYGTAYGLINGSGELNKSVVIESHCDEIAWIITYIEDGGMIRVKRHGGSDTMVAPSKRCVIHTHEGEQVRGVFGQPAIHVRDKRDSNEKGLDPHDLWIDTGVDSKEKVLKQGIQVGNVVTFDDPVEFIGDYIVGRSLDNKIGGYILAVVLEKIRKSKVILPYDLIVVNSVQEEVGLFGAKKIAKHLNADLAIVHDVCHNTHTPKINKAKDGDIKGGGGPCVEYTTQNHRGIIKRIVKTAEKHDIPIQHTVGSYGNDTMAFFLENTPTAIISSPLKYMHTTVEMIHKDDLKSAIKLFVKFLTELTEEDIIELNNRF